ncbi:MAG: FAD-dependent monooxygenase, partial [Aestuariivirga sp.]
MINKKVLISGGGIAGLTLGILLKEKGWEPTVIERDAEMRSEGYIIDFAGTGWDVAERMGLISELQKIIYPIEALTYVDKHGEAYVSLSIVSVKKALDGKYTYLRRSDLERVLFERAQAVGLVVRFATTIQTLKDNETEVIVTFNTGVTESYGLVFGTDGAHSRVRDLVFGPEQQFDRFLGYYVAAFHLEGYQGNIANALAIYEEPNRAFWAYSLGKNKLSVVYIFRHENIGYVPPQQRVALLQEVYRGAEWKTQELLTQVDATAPLFFDSATQIVMPSWSKGRIALLGDACACLTLLAGQGSHMAMAEAYVLARELERHNGDHKAAFATYELKLKPATLKKQKDAVRISKFFVPSARSFAPLRRF